MLTFFNEVTTTQTNINGPLVIPTRRNGTTTIFLNTTPASFADPDSFRSGVPVLTSTLNQQAVVDTATGAFTAVFDNTITWTTKFTIDGREFRLGRKGQAFRTTLTGHLNPAPPPLGYFAGYAVGAARR